MQENAIAGGASERPVIGTWLLLDSAEEASYYPATGFQSSDNPQVHRIYWRCVACYFASAFRMLGEAYRLVLYTTATELPREVEKVLASCEVEIERVALAHLPPTGYLQAWRNQFYILDVIRHICRTKPADVLILDSDCLFVAQIDSVFARLREEGVLTYNLHYPPQTRVNGLSRLEMRDLFGDLLGGDLTEVPAYYGGEVFAATASELLRIDSEVDSLWEECLRRAAEGLPKLNEEAHFLSFLYCKLGYRDGTANEFIRRIWTQLRRHNACREDMELSIWHVPAEKRYGLRDLYDLVINQESWFWKLPTGQLWKARLGDLLGIPEARLSKKIKDFCRGVRHKAGIRVAGLTGGR